MKFIIKIIKSKNFLPVFVVLVFAVLAARSLIFQSGYFNMHDDLQMMRQLELEKCFRDGQIPCRWVPDMGFGFGFPLFNFYPPLPYFVGEIFRLVGFSFVEAIKLTFALSFLLSGLGMYFLAKKFFGRTGATLASIFYIWAPYHSVDIYVRGAMNEAWALVFFPFIFLFSYKLIRSEKKENLKWTIALTLSYTFLFLTHNLMVMIFTPFFAVWVGINLWIYNAWKKIYNLFLSGLWIIGLSAFFTLPAVLEIGFTQVKSQLTGYYDYSAHFVTLRQLLITRFWGYGPSVWLEEDRMSFQIGHLHWILSIVVGLMLLVRYLRNKGNLFEKLKNDNLLSVTLFMLAMGWAAAFMTHSRSIFLYLKFPILGDVQFPWRFLTLVIFAFSFVVGAIPGLIGQWRSKHGLLAKIIAFVPEIFLFIVLSLSIVIMDWNYFRPEYGRMGPLTDQQKFEGRAWMLQQTAGIYDYLPTYAKEAPKEAQEATAEIMSGKATVNGMEQGTYWGRFSVDVESDVSQVRIGILKFPGWKVFMDGHEISNYIPDTEKWGRMWIEVPQGKHEIYVQFFNTPVRTAGNIISLVSWLLLIGVIVKFKPYNASYTSSVRGKL